MSDLTINTDDIAAAISKNLDGYEPSLEQTQVGRIIEVGDGIARISGLPGVGVNELLEFEGGRLGLALNLEEDAIGAVVLGEVDEIQEGQPVKATGRILSVPVGDGVIGLPSLSCYAAASAAARRHRVTQSGAAAWGSPWRVRCFVQA